MIVRRHPRRSPPISTFLSAPNRFAPKFFPLTFLADPHLLSPAVSISCRNGGGGEKGSRQSSAHVTTPLKSTLARQSASVANKRLTSWLSPVHATLTKIMGGSRRYS